MKKHDGTIFRDKLIPDSEFYDGHKIKILVNARTIFPVDIMQWFKLNEKICLILKARVYTKILKPVCLLTNDR